MKINSYMKNPAFPEILGYIFKSHFPLADTDGFWTKMDQIMADAYSQWTWSAFLCINTWKERRSYPGISTTKHETIPLTLKAKENPKPKERSVYLPLKLEFVSHIYLASAY